jgi:hypothetical protein
LRDVLDHGIERVSCGFRPKLRRGPEQPFATELGRNLLMRNDTASFGVCAPTVYGLHDVEVVQHIVHTAVVWESVEERAHGVLGGHSSLK